jgi:plastocyanin
MERIRAISRVLGISIVAGFITIASIGGYLLATTQNILPTEEVTPDDGDVESPGQEIEQPVIPRDPKEFRVLAVSKLEFRPEIIQIRAGDTVVWENPDVEVHTVTAANFTVGGDIFFNELLEPEESFRFTFTEPGTYFYSCAVKFHGMHGIIRVQE